MNKQTLKVRRRERERARDAEQGDERRVFKDLTTKVLIL